MIPTTPFAAVTAYCAGGKRDCAGGKRYCAGGTV